MSQKVDITQLCPDCNSDLSWEQVNEPGEEPAYNGRCSCSWEVFDCPKPGRRLDPLEQHVTDRIAELESANAELLATLANERGEGEAPVKGWVVVRNPMGPPARHWWWERHLVMVYRAESGVWTRNEYVPERGTIATSTHDTARAAIRAASSQGAE